MIGRDVGKTCGVRVEIIIAPQRGTGIMWCGVVESIPRIEDVDPLISVREVIDYIARCVVETIDVAIFFGTVVDETRERYRPSYAEISMIVGNTTEDSHRHSAQTVFRVRQTAVEGDGELSKQGVDGPNFPPYRPTITPQDLCVICVQDRATSGFHG